MDVRNENVHEKTKVMGKLTFDLLREAKEKAEHELERKKGKRLSEVAAEKSEGALLKKGSASTPGQSPGRPGQLPTRRKSPTKLPFDPYLAAKGCAGCPLNEADLTNPKMPPSGAAHPSIYIIGEAPGENEDLEGEQFVGKAGQKLREHLPKGYQKITRFNNVIRCRPPANRAPSPQEIECCRAQNEKDIETSKPKVVVGTGGVPLQWRLGQTTITAWRGRRIPMRIGKHKFWYMPVLHPSYVMRSEHGKNGREIVSSFKRDLEWAYSIKDIPEPIDPKEVDEGVEFVACDIVQLRKVVDEVCKWGDYAIDLETNGLRPFFEQPQILTLAVSRYDKTYAIPLAHREATWTPQELDEIATQLLPRMLKSPGKRIAHNEKFEQEWLLQYCGDEIIHEVEWHDTMAQAYTLDERGGGTKGLGTLTLIYLGFNVKSLSNLDVTKLNDYPLADVLRYNAHDAKYTVPIFLFQEQELEREGLIKTYEMHNERAGPIVLAQSRGVLPNMPVLINYDKDLSVKIEGIKKQIMEHPCVVKFLTTHERFSPTSNPNVLALMREVVPSSAKEMVLSVGEEILAEIDHPIAKLILELRKYSKQYNTYIEPFMPGGEQVWQDGKIHTEFHHLRLVTGRTSSSGPNLQNFPKRKGKEIRDVITAPPRHVIVSLDYGQIEARVIGMASKDRFLTKALWEKYDIHTEWTEKISRACPKVVGGTKFFTDKAVMKKFRDRIKNEWTFPLFFGSVLSSVSSSLGIDERTLEPLYDEFWDTFADVRVWQEGLIKFYGRNHYVETLTGRRRHAPMGYNEIINTPIQGTASDIVVDAMVRLSRKAWEEDRPQYQFRINVHDDLTFYLPEKQLETDIEVIARDMVSCPFKFVTVPLTVEASVGRTWGSMEDVGVYSSTDFH